MNFCHDTHFDICYFDVGNRRFDCSACTGDGLYECIDRASTVCE
jgi:hypothetical protein